jgi:VanZ family protein
MTHSLLLRWLPVVVWAGVIFALSSIPNLGTDLGLWDLVLRKLAHAGEYALLAALIARATGAAPIGVVAAAAYAVTDEIHQHFVPGRQGAPLDVVIDTAGAIAGALLWALWRPLRSRAA